MRSISSQITQFGSAVLLVASLGLAACGGGGGGGGGDGAPTDGGTVGLTYTGNTNPASITTTNASVIIDDLIGGAGVIESVSDVQPQAVAESSGREGFVSAANTLLSLTRSTTVKEVAGEVDYHVAAIVPVEETLPCDSGAMILSGSLDD
jgi:hypothetical protein